MRLIEADAQKITNIYQNQMINDFPEEELKPLSRILETAETGLCKVFTLMDGEEMKAYAVFIFPEHGKHLLLDYFAVIKKYRGQNIGHEFFVILKSYMRENYPKIEGIFIESERVESDIEDRITRERRIAFYLDCGCMMTQLQSDLFGVKFSILFYKLKEINEVSYDDLDYIYKAMFTPKHYETRVFIWTIE